MRIKKPSGKHFSLHKISRNRIQIILHDGAARHCPLSQSAKFTCYNTDIDVYDPELALQAKLLEAK